MVIEEVLETMINGLDRIIEENVDIIDEPFMADIILAKCRLVDSLMKLRSVTNYGV